jgi:NAD(P)-dependent dehydrogenase (short-subunit alcohol dehydrogenase family)
MSLLNDKTALVTGGGRGIGRAIALELAARGVRVAVAARSTEELEATAAEIRAAGGDAHVLTADLGASGAGTQLGRGALAALGTVDILVNNAAVVWPLGASATIDPERWAQAFTVNVVAPAALSFALLGGMLERGWGRIANVSTGIVAAPAAMVGGNAYVATKSALEAHTINLAAELQGTGVTVNAFRPGAVDTAMQGWIRDQDPGVIGAALHERFDRMHADGGLLTPETSARALVARLEGEDTGAIWDVADQATEPRT